MATVEIDLDTLPSESGGYALLVESALTPLASAESELCATIYIYEGPSVNFGNYGYSAFFGVAGDRRVLGALYTSFCSSTGLKVRHSDPISQSQAICQYHLEEGRLWRPDEEHVWCADSDESESEISDGDIEDEEGEEARVTDESKADAVPLRTELPARFRAARSDASVGSICRSIEVVYGLPEGSVALRDPDKKSLRSDAMIRTLRKRWE